MRVLCIGEQQLCPNRVSRNTTMSDHMMLKRTSEHLPSVIFFPFKGRKCDLIFPLKGKSVIFPGHNVG